MTYPESHEPYNVQDSQDAYNTQPVRYTDYGYAPDQSQDMTTQDQHFSYSQYQYPSITTPGGGYPPYMQPTYYGQSTVPYAQSQQIAQTPSVPTQAPMKKPQVNKTPKRSKAESLALLSRLKKWIIAASMLSFGTLSFLVAGNVVGVTSHTNSTSSTSTSSSTNVTTPTPSSSSGSYFQQGQSTSTSQSGQGGYGIGSSSSQGAVSSSSTS